MFSFRFLSTLPGKAHIGSDMVSEDLVAGLWLAICGPLLRDDNIMAMSISKFTSETGWTLTK